MGKKGLIISRIALSLAHFQFTIGQMSFTLESLQSTISVWTGNEAPLWVYGLIIWVIYTPLVWVRRLKFLEKAFVFAVFCIILGVITTTAFALKDVSNQGGPGPDLKPFVKDTYWNMIGFSFFMFEGIGCLLPIMREAEKPEIYPQQTVWALCILCITYILFATVCYYAWGSTLDEPVVTEMLPADNAFVEIMKLLFCLNLMISYPITITPMYTALEDLLGK